MSERKVSILGFAGSLRKGSYNRALMRAALELCPEDASLEVFDLEGILPSTRTGRWTCPRG
jgi:chromate reductase